MTRRIAEEQSVRGLAAELREAHARVLEMGGPEAVERQHAAGKLSARERLDLLFDPDSFDEFGLFARYMGGHPELRGREMPADGVVCGIGEVDGRRVAVIAYDFTVLAGSMGRTGESKAARMRELALRHRIPLVWLIDSAGARIQEYAGSEFAETGHLFREEVTMSGIVPLVAAVMGPGTAGTAYIPGLADFVPMVKGAGSLALGGPHLVKAAVGEDVTQEEIGGAEVHTTQSGVADLAVDDAAACLAAVRCYLSYFPSSNQERPPRLASDDPPDRYVEEAFDIVPGSARRAYDISGLIEAIADRDSFFEVKPRWAGSMMTGLASFGGHPVGVVANNPKFMGGAIDVNAADKAARFVWLCDAFHVPLVFLVDCPGFMVGSAVERERIIRHGAKLLYAVSEATVPKVTIVVRKAYGAGYYVMNGRAFEPDTIAAWPTAEISVMGPEGAVNIVARKRLAKLNGREREETLEEALEAVRAQISPYLAAGWNYVDDLIDPSDTRRVICRAIQRGAVRQVERPWRKHGVPPV